MNISKLIVILFFLTSTTTLAKEESVKLSNIEIAEFFNKFSKENIDLADQFYAPDCVFEDPIVRIEGRQKLKDYYRGMYKNVISIRFEFHEVITDKDQQVGIWTMYLRAKNLNGGNEVSVRGNSHVKYKDGFAIYHRDYFDMGAFIYEHIPVLGTVIQFLKKQFHP